MKENVLINLFATWWISFITNWWCFYLFITVNNWYFELMRWWHLSFLFFSFFRLAEECMKCWEAINQPWKVHYVITFLVTMLIPLVMKRLLACHLLQMWSKAKRCHLNCTKALQQLLLRERHFWMLFVMLSLDTSM